MTIHTRPHLGERVGHDFLRFVFVLQDAKREPQHPRRQGVVQLRESALVAGPEPPQQPAFLLLSKTSRVAHLDWPFLY